MKLIKYIIGYIAKNLALLLGFVDIAIGIIEQILKLAGGIVSITPSRKDDLVVSAIEKSFEGVFLPTWKKIKGLLYKIGN